MVEGRTGYGRRPTGGYRLPRIPSSGHDSGRTAIRVSMPVSGHSAIGQMPTSYQRTASESLGAPAHGNSAEHPEHRFVCRPSSIGERRVLKIAGHDQWASASRRHENR